MQRDSSDNNGINDEMGGNATGVEDGGGTVGGGGVALETGFDHEQGRHSVYASNSHLQGAPSARGLSWVYLYSTERPIIRKVSKIRIWVVPPV